MRAHNLPTCVTLVVLYLVHTDILLIDLDLSDFEHALNVVFQLLGIRSLLVLRLRPGFRRFLLRVERLGCWSALLSHLGHDLQMMRLGLLQQRNILRVEQIIAIYELRHGNGWRALLAISDLLGVSEKDELRCGVFPWWCTFLHDCRLLRGLPLRSHTLLQMLVHVVSVKILTALELILEGKLLSL